MSTEILAVTSKNRYGYLSRSIVRSGHRLFNEIERERERTRAFLRSRRSIRSLRSKIRRVRESSRRISDQAAINAIAFSALKEC